METSLVRLDRAKKELTLVKSVDDAKEIRDRAEALRVYAKEAGESLEIQVLCGEIKVRAERRAGELLREQPKNPGTVILGGDIVSPPKDIPKLSDIGISKKQSSQWQKIAEIKSDKFEKRLGEKREKLQVPTTTDMVKYSKELDGKNNNSRSGGNTFNKTNEKIEWAKWSWNPFVGCLGPKGDGNHCPYCYAKDIADRFYNHFKPQFFEKRLQAPLKTKIPESRKNEEGIRNVFLGSMTDFFGDFIPAEWIKKVLSMVQRAPAWNFLVLTKNPKRIKDFAPFPENLWIGATVDKQERIEQTEAAFREFDATVKFISCEPLLERLQFANLDIFDWVIIGGRSKSTRLPAMQPEMEWVASLLLQVDKAGCKVYCKPNLTILKQYP